MHRLLWWCADSNADFSLANPTPRTPSHSWTNVAIYAAYTLTPAVWLYFLHVFLVRFIVSYSFDELIFACVAFDARRESFLPSFFSLVGRSTVRASFEQEMPAYGITPDVVSYNSAISACSHRARYDWLAHPLVCLFVFQCNA